jgi:hypothetical protein
MSVWPAVPDDEALLAPTGDGILREGDPAVCIASFGGS